MNSQAVQDPDQLAAAYLQQLQALGYEISIAMDAIAGNALSGLQESVAKQEMLCAVLASMAKTIKNQAGASTHPLPLRADPAVEQKIQATLATIQQLTLQYAALLRHSGKSIALLASLCRSHTGQSQEARGPRLKRQTWSCEM